jgi:hypothetical protein
MLLKIAEQIALNFYALLGSPTAHKVFKIDHSAHWVSGHYFSTP